MKGVNKVMLVGNCGKDPETRYMPSGGAVTNISIATSESWKDKQSGEQKEKTEWHNLVFFGKLAEIVAEYVKKGSQIYVEGSLQTRKWQDKDGNDRYTTDIKCHEMQMLGGRGDSNQSKPAPQQSQNANQASQNMQAPDDGFSDEIPF